MTKFSSGVHGQRMCFRVEDILSQRQYTLVVSKQQIQILQRLSHKETLHVVFVDRRQFLDILNRGITIGDFGVFLYGLEDFPAVFLIDFFSRQSV